MGRFDANKALRFVLALFICLACLITLLPVMHYIYELSGMVDQNPLLNSYIFSVILSFSLLVGMCIRWVFNIAVTQIFDAMLGFVMGTICIIIAAFFTYGLVLILTLPTSVLATYLLFWHFEQLDLTHKKQV